MRKYMNSYGSFLYLGSLVGLVAILLLVLSVPSEDHEGVAGPCQAGSEDRDQGEQLRNETVLS